MLIRIAAAVNAMLLNEFLKEHRKVQELEATVAQQQQDFQSTVCNSKRKSKLSLQASKSRHPKSRR